MSPAGRQHQQGQQDSEAGKEEDVHQLQAAAMERVNSQKVVIPTASRRHLKEVDVRKLTKSQKNLMLDEALQVTYTPLFVVCKVGWCSRFQLTATGGHKPLYMQKKPSVVVFQMSC